MGAPQGKSEFDVELFGRWLNRYREAEGLQIPQIARPAGLSDSTVQALVLGRSPSGRHGSSRGYDPSITTLVRLARGLDLDLGYVLARAGVETTGARTTVFSTREQALIYRSMGTAMTTHSTVFFPLELETLNQLQTEFAKTLKSHITRPEEEA